METEIKIVKALMKGWVNLEKLAENEGTKVIYAKSCDRGRVRRELESSPNGVLFVCNAHDTFYGWGFENNMVDSLTGLSVTIEVLQNDPKEGFPLKYRLSLNK